ACSIACILLMTAITAHARGTIVASDMAGHWEGSGRIIVAWCQQLSLTVSLDIGWDDTVSGQVGDASVINGKIRRNRGWLGRMLRLRTDYVIKADLAGPIIAAEDISRHGVSIPLDFISGSFVGGLHTTGLRVGGKKHM